MKADSDLASKHKVTSSSLVVPNGIMLHPALAEEDLDELLHPASLQLVCNNLPQWHITWVHANNTLLEIHLIHFLGSVGGGLNKGRGDKGKKYLSQAHLTLFESIRN